MSASVVPSELVSPMSPRSNRRSAGAIALVAALVLATGCGGDDDPDAGATTTTTATTATADAASGDDPTAAIPYGVVSPDEAVSLIAAGVTVIDVRTPAEYAEGHIEGATLIDLSDPEFGDHIADLDPNGEYLVYCRSGNRSAQAVARMGSVGIGRVWDLGGGVVAFQAAGLPVVAG